MFTPNPVCLEELVHRFLQQLQQAHWYEIVAVLAGIASVWFSRMENTWVYPVGLINTTIYIYISLAYHLPGEACVNVYYTVMSVYGWYMWLKKDASDRKLLSIAFSGRQMWIYQLLFFSFFYVVIYFALVYLKENFFEGAIPWGDAFASATAFTGMWLMTRKKVESWYWWILTNVASIPLFYSKGLVLTSIYYFILLVMAFSGLAAWRRKAKKAGPAKGSPP